MKTFKTILAAYLLLFLSFPVLASSKPCTDHKMPPEHKGIVVKVEVGTNMHRSLIIPFDLSYQSGTIVAEFYDNIGIVSISVLNTDTGEMWNANLDSSEMQSTIDISTDNWEGCYQLMITDGMNNSYSGCFEL